MMSLSELSEVLLFAGEPDVVIHTSYVVPGAESSGEKMTLLALTSAMEILSCTSQNGVDGSL